VKVIAIREHGAASTEHAIHCSRHARADRFHSAREVSRARRFHERMQVIVLDRVLHESETPAVARRSEGALQFTNQPYATQRRQPAPNLQGDMTGMTPRKNTSRPVRMLRARAALAARTRASSTPARCFSEIEIEIELPTPLRHREQSDSSV
jgi:hypothetical protein